jgi:glycosyl transferase family 87
VSLSAGAAYALIWLGFLAYLCVIAAAPSLSRRLLWAGIAAAIAGFALTPPLLSHDIYSYIDYARLGVVHGLNPYLHPPSSAPGDPVFPEVGWTGATTIYGPLFTLATYPLAWLSAGAAVVALKGVAAASLLALTALVARIAPRRGVDASRAAAFVALNPLVLIHLVGGAHNDALAMLVAIAGVAALLASREAGAGAALAGAMAIKLSTAFLAPFALIGAERRGRLLAGALGAAAAIVVLADLAFGWHWLSILDLAGDNQGRASHMSVPVTLARLSGLDESAVRTAFLALYAGLLAHLLAWTWHGGDWLRAAGWAAAGLLLCTSWLLPWYLIWAIPLAALTRDRPLQLLILALTAYQLGARLPL